MSEYVIQFPYSTSTVASITGSTDIVTLLAADNNRGKFIISHSGSTDAFVLFGTGSPLSSSMTYRMTNGTIISEVDYKGAVKVKFAATDSTTRLFATDITK